MTPHITVLQKEGPSLMVTEYDHEKGKFILPRGHDFTFVGVEYTRCAVYPEDGGHSRKVTVAFAPTKVTAEDSLTLRLHVRRGPDRFGPLTPSDLFERCLSNKCPHCQPSWRRLV